MADDTEIRAKFWKALDKDMTVLLGLAAGEGGHVRPMTAQLEEDRFDGADYHGPIWFFTSTDNALYQQVGGGGPGVIHFASKGHDVWAAVQGTLTTSQDRAMIDKLWNPGAAAWFEDGNDDPKLRLMRLDAEQAEIWLDGSSLLAGVKSMLGIDPKQDYKDDKATVTL